MRTFKDNLGRTWNVQADHTSLRRVRTLLAFDLVAADYGAMLEKLLADPILLVDVVYVLCKPQADAAKVSDEDFGKAMHGDVIEKAGEVLLAELTDFTPNHRKREILRKALAGIEEIGKQELALVEAKLDRDLEEARKPRPISGPTSTGSPEASG